MTPAHTHLARVLAGIEYPNVAPPPEAIEWWMARIDDVLDAAEPLVRARIEAERDEAQEPFLFDGGVEAA